jgi:hypothetical protein
MTEIATAGLDIDRAWWRARTGKPGHHYTALRQALRGLADEFAQSIDLAN